jgi:hypothetical protein
MLLSWRRQGSAYIFAGKICLLGQIPHNGRNYRGKSLKAGKDKIFCVKIFLLRFAVKPQIKPKSGSFVISSVSEKSF